MNTINMILSRLSGELDVDSHLILDEIMSASHLKAALRATMRDLSNYPELREKIAEVF